MRAILGDLFGPAVVQPDYGARHVWTRPIETERVYACFNIGRPEFECLTKPADARLFVLIRDPRDTLVSAYYSFRYTYEPATELLVYYRWLLNQLTLEQSLLFLAETWLPYPAWIQRTWLEAGVRPFKMEDCVKDAPRMLGKILRERWGLKLDRPLLESVAERRSFLNLSGGRKTGQQDLHSHYRKGSPGDWRSHFTPELAQRFEALYGDLILLAGYEAEPGWSARFQISNQIPATAELAI